MAEKTVPYDVDAEEAVLGAILIDCEQAMPAVLGAVQGSDFYRDKNNWIYSAMCRLHERGQIINQVTLAHELDRSQQLKPAGGVAYLSHLISVTPSSFGAPEYAALVRKCSFSRRLIQAAGQIARIGYGNGDPAEAMGQAQEQLLSLSDLAGGGGLRSLGEIARRHDADIEAWLERPDLPRGVRTGYADLDAAIGGWEPGKFYVLAARPSMGKSTLALALSVKAAQQGKAVAFYSLEMSELALLFRLVLSQAKLNRYALRLNELVDGWPDRFMATLGQLSELPIWIDDTSSITTAAVRARSAQLKARLPNLGLVVFDYGDLAGDEGDREEERMAAITRRLADMAKALEVAVLGVYQLNRAVEGRENKRPMMSDLRGSGRIEQRADAVMMLYREAYYLEADGEPVSDEQEHSLELLIRKQRDGATGCVKLWFDRKTGEIQGAGRRPE